MAMSPEILLREYETHPDALGVREGLHAYVKEGWLERTFKDDESCVRAKHFVGVLPFMQSSEESGVSASRVLTVLPKGCDPNVPAEAEAALKRFVELAFFYDHSLIESLENFSVSTKSLGELFLKLIAYAYCLELTELCRHDFRRDYRHHDAELHGRVRGRIAVGAHLRNALRGRGHVVPCRWEEFTADNWDNRILLGAFRALERYASAISVDAARTMRQQFRHVAPWFTEVEECHVGSADLRRMRLHRVSDRYRRAKRWAEVILRGMGTPAVGSGLRPFVIDANRAFEEFASHLTRQAAIAVNPDWSTTMQQPLTHKMLDDDDARRPDVTVLDKFGPVAIGDAKYKDVLEWAPGSAGLSDPNQISKAAIGPADWNQLYVYMRLSGAPRGFFIVPYWSTTGAPVVCIRRQFAIGPLDSGLETQVAVFAVNLMRRVSEIRSRFTDSFKRWMGN